MTAADRNIIATAAEGVLLARGLSDTAEGAPRELRLMYRGYDGSDGLMRLRDGPGETLFFGPIRTFLETIPCFTAETMVATERGLCAVAELEPGLRVMTRDNGLQELRWIGRRAFGWQALGLNPLLRPVQIARGALGRGMPDRDMLVSPNHRFLTLMPGEGESGERLVMARDLVGLDGVTFAAGTAVEYWQLLLGRHELVLADGCWSESFRPIALNCAALSEAGRSELREVLPDLDGAGENPAYAPARPDMVSPADAEADGAL